MIDDCACPWCRPQRCMVCGVTQPVLLLSRADIIGEEAWYVCDDAAACRARAGDLVPL